MKRKVISIVLVLGLVLTAAGCNDNSAAGQETDPVKTEASSQEKENAETTKKETTKETKAQIETDQDKAGQGTADKKVKIGVSTDTSSTVFRTVELMGLYSAAEAAGNVEIIELNADDDTTTQYTQIKSLVDQGIDVLVCCAIDQDAILTAYDYAQAAGIPVINYDRRVEHEAVMYNVIYDSYSDAKQLAEFILAKDDGKEHTILLTVGSLADPNGIARREGFKDTLKGHDNLKIVEVMTDWDVDECLTNMQNALQVNPDPWAVINVSAHMDGACMQALEEVGLKKKVGEEGHVNYASLSGEPPSLTYLQEGYSDAIYVIPADLCGGAVFDAAMKLVNGETLESDEYDLPTFECTLETFDSLKDKIWTYVYSDMLE